MDYEPRKTVTTIEKPDKLASSKFKKIKISKKQFIVLAVIAVVFFVIIFLLIFFVRKKTDSDTPGNITDQSSSQSQQQKTHLRLIATGDMIPHDAINERAKQSDGSYEYSNMFGEMGLLFKKSDIRFCNQAVLAGANGFGVSGYPVFNSPTEFSRDMTELGCNVINTGSNHTNDLSQKEIDTSLNNWDKLDVKAVAGANRSKDELNKIRYFEADGVKFSFLSYTTYSNKPSSNGYSVTMYDAGLAKSQITQAKSNSDIVIVSMRWGTEYSSDINENQKKLSKELADMGVDIVFGHGPHVLEPVDQITNKDNHKTLVWYSLGNFFNAQLELEALFNGIAVLDINLSTKTVDGISYLPVYMHYEWSESEKAQNDLMARKNFNMFTFEDGQSALESSQNKTTFDEQRNRISATLNQLSKVKIINKDQYLNYSPVQD